LLLRLGGVTAEHIPELPRLLMQIGEWVPELFLISLLAAFCGGLAWIHDHELFAAAFAAAAVVAASQARPR
jgi:hypothetical protein